MKGVPVRMAIGARDLENNTVELARRDTKEKTTVSMDGIAVYIKTLLDDIQLQMYNKAKSFREERITAVDTWEDFIKTLDEKGGFVSAHWDGTGDTEDKIKDLAKATIRCIPLNNVQEEGKCILTGNPSKERVLFARAY
jgi:prolyl-tRNA synthetase